MQNPVSKIRSKFPCLTKESYLVDMILALLESDTEDYDSARYPDPRRYVIQKLKNLVGENPGVKHIEQVL